MRKEFGLACVSLGMAKIRLNMPRFLSEITSSSFGYIGGMDAPETTSWRTRLYVHVESLIFIDDRGIPRQNVI